MNSESNRPGIAKVDPGARSRARPRLLSGLHEPKTLLDRILLAQVLGPPRSRRRVGRRKIRYRIAR